MKKTLVIIFILGLGALASAQEGSETVDPAAESPSSEQAAGQAGQPAPGSKSLDSAIVEAFNTPPDVYGVPQGLYPLDRSLRSHLNSIKRTEKAAGILGIIGGVAIAGGVAGGILLPDLVWAPSGVTTPIPYGYFLAGLGVAVVVVDLSAILPAIDRDKLAMRRILETHYEGY